MHPTVSGLLSLLSADCSGALPRNRRQTRRTRALPPHAQLRRGMPRIRCVDAEQLSPASPAVRRVCRAVLGLCAKLPRHRWHGRVCRSVARNRWNATRIRSTRRIKRGWQKSGLPAVHAPRGISWRATLWETTRCRPGSPGAGDIVGPCSSSRCSPAGNSVCPWCSRRTGW